MSLRYPLKINYNAVTCSLGIERRSIDMCKLNSSCTSSSGWGCFVHNDEYVFCIRNNHKLVFLRS